MNIGIVGGGLTGLVTGYGLCKRGHSVMLFEAGPEPGGQVATINIGGGRVEKLYHHIFTSDLDIISIINELGLGQSLQWLDSKVAFFAGNQLHDFVTPMDLLRFNAIGLIDRFRLGLVGLYLQRHSDWRKFEHIAAKDWITKYAGKSNYEAVWGPLLKGKFGESAGDVGMVWFWGKIHQRFASRGEGMQREKLGYLAGSFGLLVDALVKGIADAGGVVRTNCAVKRIFIEGSKAVGLEAGSGGEKLPFDAIVATVPSPVLLRLAPELPNDYAARLRLARYQAALC
ncbi:MAG: FAD-dependent oxidoreductase, partial [Chloroflexota bacterium]